MSSIRLFGNRLSPFVDKVVRALDYKRIDYEFVEATSPLQMRSWSPRTRKMPVLEIDGERIDDSTRILRDLDERFSAPRLVSEDIRVAAAQRQLEDWADESLYWYVMAVRWKAPNARATTQQMTAPLGVLWRLVARLVFPRYVRRMTVAQGLGRLPHETLLHEFGRLLDDAVRLLGSKPYFYSDRLSVGDLAFHGQLRFASSGPTPDLASLISHRPALVDYTRRVEEATRR